MNQLGTKLPWEHKPLWTTLSNMKGESPVMRICFVYQLDNDENLLSDEKRFTKKYRVEVKHDRYHDEKLEENFCCDKRY